MNPTTPVRLQLPAHNVKLIDCRRAEVEHAVEQLAAQPRYAHHTRMPLRICQSFDYFRVRYDRPRTAARLTGFYLFVGAADDWLDEQLPERGSLLLARFGEPVACFSPEVVGCPALLATEFLKSWVAPERYPEILAGMHELYDEVVREQHAANLAEYISARRATGRLSADLSYLLVADELTTHGREVRAFMAEVGAVGNLIDSLFDLPGDMRRGLLRFRPSLTDRLRLLAQVVADGVTLAARHLGLVGLFAAAVHDTWRDSWRRDTVPARPHFSAAHGKSLPADASAPI